MVFGDYTTGGNHVLQTGGLARSYSGLVTHDFFRWTCYPTVTRDAEHGQAGDTTILA